MELKNRYSLQISFLASLFLMSSDIVFALGIDLKNIDLDPQIDKNIMLGFSLGFLNDAGIDYSTALNAVKSDGFTHLRMLGPFVKANNGRDDAGTSALVIADIKTLSAKGFNIMLSFSDYPYKFAPAFPVDPDPYDNVDVMDMFNGVNSGFTNRFPPEPLDDYAQFLGEFMTALRSEFGDSVLESWFFEFGNEPDAPRYFWGSPNEYEDIYSTTAKAFNSVGLSSSQVGGASFTSSLFEKDGSGAYIKQEYVDKAKIFSKGAATGLITFHRYEVQFSSAQATKQEYGANLNGNNKTKAITEWNICAGCVNGIDVVLGGGKTNKFDYFMSSLADVLEFSYDQNVNYLYVHKLMDKAGMASLGIFDSTGNPKPAYNNLKEARDVIQNGYSAYDLPEAIVIRGKQKVMVRAKGKDAAQLVSIDYEGYAVENGSSQFNFYGTALFLPQGEWVIFKKLDTQAPFIAITSPTTGSTYTAASATLGLSGAASDNVGVGSVTWSNSATGASGAAAGTTAWSIVGVSLASGTNIITVTAKDAANNISTDTITVTYTATVNPAPVITSSLSVVGTVGTGLSYQIAAANSPTNFNATGLPAGLSVSTATGRISGTPATVGISSVTISAINVGGAGSAGLALSVYSACDLNRDWSANVADVQLQVNQALGFAACASDLNGDGLCNVADVQRGIVAGLGGACVLGP